MVSPLVTQGKQIYSIKKLKISTRLTRGDQQEVREGNAFRQMMSPFREQPQPVVDLPGRAFLRILIKTTFGILKAYYRNRLNKEVKADLHTWQAFLRQFNGRSIFLPYKQIERFQ